MDDETGSTSGRLRAVLRWLGAAAALAGIVGVVFQVIEWVGSRDTPSAEASVEASPTSAAPPTARANGDEQFVQVGQCVHNVGDAASVVYEITPCGSGTWRVLARIEQAVANEAQADALGEAQAPGFADYHYSNWAKRSGYLDVVFCVSPA
ncbi:hypothetical protein [Micromonospora sp. NPDC005206]|uniref:hypothetical protein n=1 Tax=Micromonospora sp. NPDC005206 TaxID=3157022 RepID=UPI0033BBAB61